MVKEDPEVAKQDPQRVGTLKLSLIDNSIAFDWVAGGKRGVESRKPRIFRDGIGLKF